MRQTYTITTTAAVASALMCTRSGVNIYWNKLQIFLTLTTLTNSNNNITVFQLCKYLLHRLYGYEKQNMYTQRSGGWRRGSALGHPLHAMLHWRKKKKKHFKESHFFYYPTPKCIFNVRLLMSMMTKGSWVSIYLWY